MGKKARQKHQRNTAAQGESSLRKTPQKGIPIHIIALAIIVLTGFFLRFHFINANMQEKRAFFPGDGIGFGNAQMLGWDGVRYDWIATNVTTGNGYGYKPGKPDAWRPPGYPFFLIAVYSLFGKDYYTTRLLQVILSTLTILLSYLIAARIAGRIAGIGAALVCALYHDAVVFPLLYYSETLFMFLVSLLLYMLMRFDAFDNRSAWLKWGYPILIGIIGGYATLVRPIYLLASPFVIAGVIWSFGINSSTIKKIAVMMLAMIVTLIPWCIRNSIVLGRPAFISTNGGLNLAMGSCEQATGYFLSESKRFTPEEKKIIAAKGYAAVVKNSIRQHPARAIGLYIKKIGIQFFQYSRRKNLIFFSDSPIPMIAYFPVTLLLFFSGFTLSFFKGTRRFALIYGYLAGYILMDSFFFYMGDRHRIPLVPVYAVFGGYVIDRIFRLIHSHRKN